MGYFCELKIADFKPHDFQNLEIKLITLQRFVGINQLIGDPEMEMLLEFLAEELKDFSITEIEYAIKLAVAGHIEVKIDHWQAFTAQYLYPIFNKYRLLRSAVLNRYYTAEDELNNKFEKTQKPQQTKEEIFLQKKRMCESAFENYKLTIPVIGMPKVFDVLWELNLIPYTQERMHSFEKIAASELKVAAKHGGVDKAIYEAYIFSLKSKINLNAPILVQNKKEYERKLTGHNAIVNKTKEVATRNVFAYLVETNTEIGTYFETNSLATDAEK